MLLVLATVPGSRGAHTAALIAGLVAGVLLLIAALTFYFYWLTTPSRRHSWTASAMVVLAAQVLASSAAALVEPTGDRGIAPWATAVDLLATAVVLVLMLLGGRALPNPQPLLVGIGLGMALTVLHAAGPVGQSLVAPSAATVGPLLITIVVGHLAIALLVARDHNLSEWSRNRLVLTILLVGLAQVARSGAFEGWATDLAAAIGQVGAAVLWASATFVMLRDALANQHRRSIVLEESLLEIESSLRGSREQLHEIRSTIAGTASASRLLDDTSISPVTHARLERAIRTELDRLERLVTQEPPASPGPVDLDATLDVLLAAHRAQGRTVVWEPSGGAAVHARPDDVAEALNILLDNAATHGGTASRVAVTRAADLVEIAVSDEGPGVPPEAREGIFDWGVHGSESPGEGIGLSVARRLVTEHGGTLTLAESDTALGSSFIIRLPAARRSEEVHVRDAGH
ncbi:ATP-binding protein [Nocardioides sp.]|uniref:sensor histidine kinase n=1 Tax=Nocardioides sp. TaxID=35761 RepID=UPI00286E6038|nr:ATP-binding protein [Nocardioides sp.]